MKLRAALPLAILCSLSSCDPEIQPEPAFHITYELPQSLSRPVSIVTLGGRSIMATNPATDHTPILICINEFGEIQWSKTLSTLGNGFTVSSLNKVDDNTFLLAGNLTTGYPIIIRFDIDGNIISSKKYTSTEKLGLTACNTNSAGTTVCTGSFFVISDLNGFAFKEDNQGNTAWAVKTPGVYMVDALTNEPGTNTFLFPAFRPTKVQPVIKLDSDGALVKSTELLNPADLFLEQAVTVGDNFYLVYTDWNTSMVYLIKINSEGEYIKSKKFADSENPEVDAHNSKIYLTLTILGNLNVTELDSDLNITNRKTVVNLVGGDASTLHAHVEVSDAAISSIIEPFSIDPTYGDKGLNAIRILLADWTTKCAITQSNLTTSSTSFQTNAGSSVVETLDLAKEDITVQVQDVVLNQTSICR